MTLKRILAMWAAGMIIFGAGFIVWALVVFVRIGDAVEAVQHQASVSSQTARAMVRLTQRMDVQVEAMLMLRDRVVNIESDVRHLNDYHHGEADARASDADAD